MKKIDKKILISFTIFVISMAFFLLLSMRSESDYFWHIKAGEYMFNHGILKEDVFSWYVSGKYWMSHEWLFEIIIYGLKLVFHDLHLVVYGFVCICSLLLILFFANKDNYLKNIPFSMIWFSLSAMLLAYMQGRPHLISFNLLALTIWFLYDNYKNESSKLIFFLPVITIIWANVHGGSSNLCYLLPLMFFIFGLFNFNRSKVFMKRMSKKQLLKYLIIAIICMLCININIHGFKMFVYPYQNMMDKTMLENIAEWAPTNLNYAIHWVYLLFVVWIFFIMLFSKKKIDFVDLMLFGFAVVLGFKSIRFWSYTYIIMSFIAFNYIEKRKLDKGTNIVLLSVSGIIIMAFCLGQNILNNNIHNHYLNKKVIKTIKAEKPKRLFNMYDYGGELVYNDIKVFIDGRADLYSKYNYSDYLNLSNLSGDYMNLLEKYNFDYLLVSSDYPINTYLKYSADYSVVYKKDDYILYKKNS